MYTAVLTMCLGWSLGQVAGPVPSDVTFLNQRGVRLPLNAQGRAADIREMRLFVSNDLGKSWQQTAVVSGEKEHISFTAPTDGQYWVQVAVVGLDGRQEPENIYLASPKHVRKIIIDTLKPFVRITSAKRHGDEVVVGWEIQEEYPDWASFKVEYQMQPSPHWHHVPATPSHVGQARFKPAEPGAITVRIKLQDRAGNLAVATAEVGGHAHHHVPGGLALAGGQDPLPPPMFPPTSDAPPPGPPLPVETPREGEKRFPPPGPVPPPYTPPAYTPPSMPPSAPPVYVPPSQPPAPMWTPDNQPTKVIHHPNGKLVASTDTPNCPTATPAPCQPAPISSNRKNLPALQYVNTPEVTIEYELTKVGPSGVGSVDLWWTQNDGQTWEKYAWDPEAKGPGQHKRTVELPGDGVYGFLLVVKSRAGMGRPEPRPGDLPEIRVEVDTLPPIAQLYAPVPDPQRGNALILNWLAKDNNLTSHPITLEWAERREGPWHPIAVNLPNTGRHSWQLPDQLPVQVYLRIRARDCAGNEGIATTPEPQLVDLSQPEGRLITVTGSPRR